MSLRVAVKPELLRWACVRAGRDVEALAERFDKLPAWIRGEAQPTLKQLEGFAKATHMPIGYFFLSAPVEERVPIPDFRTVANARTRRPSPDLLETIYICQQRQDWYREFARLAGDRPLPFVGSVTVGSDVTTTAQRMRDALGFSLEAQRDARTWTDALRAFIEKADTAGIMVMCSGVVLNNNTRKLDPDEFRGFAIADDLAPVVFINGADTKAAQMFTLAHELAHVWLGQSAVSDMDASHVPDHEIERWCNQVAAELLVPLAALQREYDVRDDLNAAIQYLTRYFKVSSLVILRRLHDLGALTRKQMWTAYEAELERLRALPKNSGGSFYLTLPVRVSKRFARALIISTLEGQTLHRDAFRMLGFSKHATFVQLGHSLEVM